MDYPHKSHHIWSGKLDKSIVTGAHTIKIKTIDMYGHKYEANRIIYVVE